MNLQEAKRDASIVSAKALRAETESGRRRRLSDIIYENLAQAGPASESGLTGGNTIQRLAEILCRKEGSICRRLMSLRKRGFVRHSGKHRRGVSRRRCIVWELIPGAQNDCASAYGVLQTDFMVSGLQAECFQAVSAVATRAS